MAGTKFGGAFHHLVKLIHPTFLKLFLKWYGSQLIILIPIMLLLSRKSCNLTFSYIFLTGINVLFPTSNCSDA